VRQAGQPRLALTPERPIPERRIIERPRLLCKLEDTRARTLLLIAPAGYGKTTLARQWVDGQTAAWFAASLSSSDVVALARGLAKALAIHAPGIPRHVDETLRAIPNPIHELPVIAQALVSELDGVEQKLLVIDDYHALEPSSTAEQLIELLEEKAVLRLLIASRTVPRWATARRHIYGEIFELHRDDLALDNSEAAELLRDTPSGDQIMRRARGWPAVIGLAAFAGAPGAPLRHTISHTLYDFLADESFSGAPRQTQHALFDMALMPSLKREALHEHFGPDAEEIIASSARTGLLDVSRHGIDLHPLAREFLLAKLRGTPAAEERVREAVRHAIAQSAWDEAFSLVQGFQLHDQLEQLISASFLALLTSGRLETLARFNRHARSSLQGTTAVMDLIGAEIAFRDGQLARAQDLALAAAAGFSASHHLKSHCYVLGGTAALVAFDLETSLQLHTRGLRFAREPQDERAALWGQCLALIYLEDEKCHEAARKLRRLSSVTPEAKLRAATAQLLVSRLGDGLLKLDAALASSDLLDQVFDPRARTSFGNVCSYVLALRGRYDEARVIIDTSLADADLYHLTFAKPHLQWTRAMIALGLRQFSLADGQLRAVESAAQGVGDHHLELNARTLRARMLLAQNRPHDALEITALEWDSVPSKAMYGEYMATRALALAVGNELAGARLLLRKARGLTSVVEVQALAATTAAISALDTRAARTIAERALALAARFDTWDALVCGVRAAPRLLDVLAASPANRRHLLGMLSRSHDDSLLRIAGLSVERRYGKAGLLSRREREVADLLCQGLTNKEIARTLCIAEATAKVHVQHIRDKLGARTRTEAVALYIPSADAETGVVADSRTNR
jgi:ATP/maltotriose-dependent transcriptional regulator MalT